MINKAILFDSFVSYMSSHIDVIVIHNFGNFSPWSEFTIVIFIHYKPRIAVAILDL